MLFGANRLIGCQATISFSRSYNVHHKSEERVLSLPKDGPPILFLRKSAPRTTDSVRFLGNSIGRLNQSFETYRPDIGVAVVPTVQAFEVIFRVRAGPREMRGFRAVA